MADLVAMTLSAEAAGATQRFSHEQGAVRYHPGRDTGDRLHEASA